MQLVYSGSVNYKKLPYIQIEKVSNALDFRDTCGNRIENNIFRINAFDSNNSRLIDTTNKIEDEITWKKLTIGNRRFMSMLYVSSNYEELEPGLYRSQTLTEVITQKDFSGTNYLLGKTEGNNFFEAIYTRWKNNLDYNFVTTRFGKEDWKRPIAFVPEYEKNINFVTTKSRIDDINFSITVEGYNPEEIEDIMEEIDNLYSYSGFTISNRRFTNMEWMGDSLFEVSPELWHGSIEYVCALEKDM